MPRHSIFKLLKTNDREKILNAYREQRSVTDSVQQSQKLLISHEKVWKLEGSGTTYYKYCQFWVIHILKIYTRNEWRYEDINMVHKGTYKSINFLYSNTISKIFILSILWKFKYMLFNTKRNQYKNIQSDIVKITIDKLEWNNIKALKG